MPIHQRLREHTENARAIRTRTDRRIERQFGPLRTELAYYLDRDRERLAAAAMLYPDNDIYRAVENAGHAEPPIGWMLTELLQHRICLIERALHGLLVPALCTPDRRQHVMYHSDLERMCGTSDLSDDEVTGLVSSCAAEYLTAFQLKDVIFTATGSMFGDVVFLNVSAPTFP